MTLQQVGGVLLIFLICPTIGALPLLQWLVYGLTRLDLRQIGTGNVSVSAAFYHGGRWAGIAAVLSEAGKGVAAVLLARLFFPPSSVWELVAIISLVLGRFWASRGAGVTNVVWAMLAHDPIVMLLGVLFCGVGFTIVRERQAGKLLALAVLPGTLWLMHPDQMDRVGAAIVLSGLLYWIYQKVPDDLDLKASDANPKAQKVFRFFQADRSIATLDDLLDVDRVGDKIALLSQLRRWGYAVPSGWVWQAGDDLALMAEAVQPDQDAVVIVRSSPCGEASVPPAAQESYGCIAKIHDGEALALAIEECWKVYDRPEAVAYRRDRDLGNHGMAILIQREIHGIFSGTAYRVGSSLGSGSEAAAAFSAADAEFSDITSEKSQIPAQGSIVEIEAWLGEALRRQVSRLTVERYRVERLANSAPLPVPSESNLPTQTIPPHADRFAPKLRSLPPHSPDSFPVLPASQLPDWIAAFEVTPLPREDDQPSGELPDWLLREVAAIVWQLEARLLHLPITIDWSYDGDRLWILG
jgi:glycerol-3-phosphate acyltransferase PlsY